MPYTTPHTIAAAELVTVATMNNEWGGNVAFLANPPACRVYHNTTQSMTHNTFTALAFNSERYDTNTMHDTVTNNGRITFTTAGLYVVDFGVELATAADYTRIRAGIRLNGATYIKINEVGTTTQSDAHEISVGTTYKFAASDYVEALVNQVNGASAARNANSSGNYSPEFSATWIGLG